MREDEQTEAATGPRQPSQAEGDRQKIAADLREKEGADAAGGAQPPQPRGKQTPASRDPRQHPGQAEDERQPG
jgi:hypothetical protein